MTNQIWQCIDGTVLREKPNDYAYATRYFDAATVGGLILQLEQMNKILSAMDQASKSHGERFFLRQTIQENRRLIDEVAFGA